MADRQLPAPNNAPTLSFRQAMLLHGVLPVVLVAVLLPLGLTALFLVAMEASVRLTVAHGELYLAGGNAALAGCIALAAARTDQAANVAIISLLSFVLFVMPCYGLWAFISAGTLTGHVYARWFVEFGGVFYALSAIAVSLACVRYAYRPNPKPMN